MSILYPLKSGLNSLLSEKWINLLSIISVGASLMIGVLAFLMSLNIDAYTSSLPDRFTMIVYLKDDVSAEDLNKLMDALKAADYTSSANYISRDEALAELKSTLKAVSNAVEGLDENPLSPSIELKLKRERVSTSSAKRISEEIGKLPGVDEVYYEAKIAEAVYKIKTSVENLSVIILVMIGIVVIFIISSTVKILFHRRKAEIETLKLLGATKSFIRISFLIEGGIIGLSGGVLASIGTWAMYYTLLSNLGAYIPIMKTLIMPLQTVAALPLVGIVMGIAASLISVGRIKL